MNEGLGNNNALGCCGEGSCDDCRLRLSPRAEEEKRAIDARLNKIIGQLNGIKRMVDQDRYCGEVLIQLSAAANSIKSVANLILEGHLRSCVTQNIKQDNLSVLDELMELIKRFQ